MTKKVILGFKVEPDKVQPLMAFLEKNLPNVREFDGCSQVAVYFNQETREMIFDELWASVAHHHNYLDAITESGVMAELSTFLASKPEIKYFDLVDL